jgi:hypothetical protein
MVTEFVGGEGFDGCPRADRHEDRRGDCAVGSLEKTGASAALRITSGDGKWCHTMYFVADTTIRLLSTQVGIITDYHC